tara:strand:+ start:11228 stop:11632 length:405 start_codon:yes stop_codon:yes gene_type:complete
MKNQVGIWLDSANATIVSLKEKNQDVKHIESNIENRVHHSKESDKGSWLGTHHVNDEKKFGERIKHQFQHYFDEIITHLKTADEIYIIGPAQAKIKLGKHIESNSSLAKKVVKIEVCDSITEKQIISKVKSFFG